GRSSRGATQRRPTHRRGRRDQTAQRSSQPLAEKYGYAEDSVTVPRSKSRLGRFYLLDARAILKVDVRLPSCCSPVTISSPFIGSAPVAHPPTYVFSAAAAP